VSDKNEIGLGVGVDTFVLNVADMKYAGKPLEDGKKFIIVNGDSDKPMKIHVDTDTDWAALSPSIAGILVTLLVAWLTLRLQRRQTLANLSGFRQQWMAELRAVSSEYLQLLYKMALRIQVKPGFRSTDEYLELYEAMVIAGSRFEMLLSRDDNDTKIIDDQDQKIVDAIVELKEGQNCGLILDMLDQMKHLIREELESAWNDIKVDVGLKTDRSDNRKLSKKLASASTPEIT